MGGYNEEGMTDYEEAVNWDNVGSIVEKGDYDIEVVKAEYAQTKDKVHMLKVQFKIEHAYDDDNIKSVGRTLFDNWVFSQKGGFRPKQFAIATGKELPKVVNMTLVKEWADTVIGEKVGVTVSHNDFNGQTRANVVKFFPYQSGTTAASDAIEDTPAPAAQRAPAKAPAPAQQTMSLREGAQNGANGVKTQKPAAKTGAPAMRR